EIAGGVVHIRRHFLVVLRERRYGLHVESLLAVERVSHILAVVRRVLIHHVARLIAVLQQQSIVITGVSTPAGDHGPGDVLPRSARRGPYRCDEVLFLGVADPRWLRRRRRCCSWWRRSARGRPGGSCAI